MAYKYKLKEEKYLDSVTKHKGKRYVGRDCSQEDLETLYNGGVDFVERVEIKKESKKESKKVTEDKKSVDEQEG